MADKIARPHSANAVVRTTEFDWQDLQIFLAVVEGGSMRSAARKFSAHQSTISRRIGNLESQIGGKLITRDGMGCPTCNLTEKGHDVLSLARGIEQQISAFRSS